MIDTVHNHQFHSMKTMLQYHVKDYQSLHSYLYFTVINERVHHYHWIDMALKKRCLWWNFKSALLDSWIELPNPLSCHRSSSFVSHSSLLHAQALIADLILLVWCLSWQNDWVYTSYNVKLVLYSRNLPLRNIYHIHHVVKI